MIARREYWDEKAETMSLKELKRLQLKKLKHLLRYVCANNRFYKRRFKDAGVKPEDIKTLEDIGKIPPLTKDELRNYYPLGLTCISTDEILEIHASSGTTGKPVVAPYTKKDLEIWTEVMARCLWANGVRRTDILQNAYGYGLFTGAHGFERGAQRIGALVIPTSSGNTKRQLQLMKDLGTTALACTPTYSLYMAEEAVKAGYNLKKDFHLRLGLFGAEAWSDKLRDKIEDVWDIKALEHYGLTEIIGPGVSLDCGLRAGLHINADHFLAEVIDPNTGEHVAEGEKGELVFTTLTKEAFPVIRFRTKDLASYTEEKCECGRTMPRHSRILGRSDDMLKVKGVIVFPSQLEEAMMKVKGASENYQIEKYTEHGMPNLRIKLEPTQKRFKEGNLENLRKAVEYEIYGILNMRVDVEIAVPFSLPRSEGKAKRVVDVST